MNQFIIAEQELTKSSIHFKDFENFIIIVKTQF